MFQGGVVDQEKKTLTVGIKSSGGIDIAGERSEGSERAVAARVKAFGELRNNAVGLVEQEDGWRNGRHAEMYDLKSPETKASRCFF